MRNFTKSGFDLNEPETISVIDELPFWSAPFGISLLDVIVFRQKMSVLDIGCGLGFPVIEVANRVGNSSRVYGLDPWHGGLERARKKVSIFGKTNIVLLEAAAESIPLPDSSVDLIISNNGINNVSDLSKVFAEIGRVAKPGAQFAAAVNLDGTMFEFYDIFVQVLSDFNQKELIQSVMQHIYEKRRPVSEYKELLIKNGFGNISADEHLFSYRFADGTAMFDHPVIQFAFMDSWLSIVPDESVNVIFNEIENRINEQSRNKGEWKLTVPYVIINAYKKM